MWTDGQFHLSATLARTIHEYARALEKQSAAQIMGEFPGYGTTE